MEFLIAAESMVVSVESREGKRLAPFISPCDLGSNRAHSSWRLEPKLFFLLPHLPPLNFSLPSPMSFVVRQALSVVRIQIRNPNPGDLRFFLTFAHGDSDADCFQARQAPLVILCPPKGSALLQNSPRRDTHTQFYRFAPRRFRPRFVPQGTQGIQASAKGTTSRVFTCPRPQNSFITSSISLGCQ